MKTALVVIDVQRALCEGKYEVFEAQKIIERINSLSRNAREAGIPVVVVQHEAGSGVMARGSAGWQFARGLIVESTDVVLGKATADSFHKTELHPWLAGLEIERLVVCGMQSDFCVDTTIRRALALGFSITLVSDAHSTLPNEHLSAQQIIAHHNTTLSNIQSFGVIACWLRQTQCNFKIVPSEHRQQWSNIVRSLTHGSSGHPIVGGTSLGAYFTFRAANYRMPLNLNVRQLKPPK